MRLLKLGISVEPTEGVLFEIPRIKASRASSAKGDLFPGNIKRESFTRQNAYSLRNLHSMPTIDAEKLMIIEEKTMKIYI